MADYRVREFGGYFNIQIKVIKTKGIFKWKRNIEEWRSIDMRGRPFYVYEYINSQIPMYPLKNIDEAKEKIKQFEKGEIIHNI